MGPNSLITGLNGSKHRTPVRVDSEGRLLMASGMLTDSFLAQLTRATSGGAYAQYDCIGAVWTIEPPLVGSAEEEVWYQLDMLTVVDPAGLNAGLTFWFFQLDPLLNGSTVANNAAPAFANASKVVLVGKVEVQAADYTISDALEGVATLTNLGVKMGSDDDGKMYVVVTKTGAGTTDWGGANLYYTLGFSRG